MQFFLEAFQKPVGECHRKSVVVQKQVYVTLSGIAVDDSDKLFTFGHPEWITCCSCISTGQSSRSALNSFRLHTVAVVSEGKTWKAVCYDILINWLISLVDHLAILLTALFMPLVLCGVVNAWWSVWSRNLIPTHMCVISPLPIHRRKPYFP